MVREDGEDNREALRRVIYMEPDGLTDSNWMGWRESLHGGYGNRGPQFTESYAQPAIGMLQEGPGSRRSNEPHVFALNEDDTLLMIPGAKMRVDTHKHILGSPSLTER